MFNKKIKIEIDKIRNELLSLNAQLHLIRMRDPTNEYIEELKKLNSNSEKNMLRLEQLMQQIKEAANAIKPEKNYTSGCF
jgi:uncharacterized protein YukE